MSKVYYVTVDFHHRGFVPGIDISEEELEALQKQFMEMYNLWANTVNTIQDKINATWETYENMLKDGMDVLFTQELMGIDDKTDYYSWCEKWYKDAASAVDIGYLNTRLKGNIFYDGECPLYGVAFRDHPNWTMDFTMKVIDEKEEDI